MQEDTPTIFIGFVPALCMLAGLAIFAAYLATGRRLNGWVRLPVILLAAGVPVILLVLFWPEKTGDRSVQSYVLLNLASSPR